MFRLSPPNLIVSTCAMVGAIALSPVPAAAAGGAYYSAQLAAPAAKTRFVSRDVVWLCEETDCRAPRGTSRPAIMCAALAKEVGPVAGFLADGKALDSDALARCNGKD